MRELGRSRTYAYNDLPTRLMHWHSPRANRWERLCVTAGRLCTQWLDASGAVSVTLDAGNDHWIAPGVRWRVTDMHPHTCFELQIYAADATPANQPQALRAALLEEAERTHIGDAAAFEAVVAQLAVGAAQLLQGEFDCRQARDAMLRQTGQYFFWHPLRVDADGFTAFITRSDAPVGLLDYLGRDHAVIEAALAGALRGDTESAGWLHATLGRHLDIEENLLFPRYLAAGGRASWVQGLCNEHVMLRQLLDTLTDAKLQRRFLLLLDGHDEKEEQIVYPDILMQLGDDAMAVTRAAMLRLPPLAAVTQGR